MPDTQVSGKVINQILKDESDYFSQFIHQNFGPNHTVQQGTVTNTSPYGSFNITNYTSAYTLNHSVLVQDFFVQDEGGNTFEYKTIYTRNYSPWVAV